MMPQTMLRQILFAVAGVMVPSTVPRAQTAWTRIAPTPSARLSHAMTFDQARRQVVVFGGSDGTTTPLGDTWTWNGTGWLVRSAGGPSPRWNSAMVDDLARARVVLFGGFDANAPQGDTWEWSGSTWTRRSPATSPPARFDHAMAHDSLRGRTVLFGGSDGLQRNDTWEYDGTTWTQRSPATVPPASAGHAMAYDAARQRVVMFGFWLGNATWEWDGTNWTQRSTSPSQRLGHAMAYDSDRQRIVLFGNAFTGDDTWEYDGTTWTQVSPATRPSGRGFQRLAYDSVRQRMVLFGGETLATTFNVLGDTWEFDASTWSRRSAGGASPAARGFHSMAYDSARDRIVVFGGDTGGSGTVFGDTWEFDGLDWSRRSSVLSPGLRTAASAAYDAARGRMVVFSGLNASGNYYIDTWEWDGTNWAQRQPTTWPSPRFNHAMTWDAARQRVLLFGGSQGTGGNLDETWEWDGNNWNRRFPVQSPPARNGHAMAYDSARARVVLYGGYANGNGFDDTWEWDGNGWSQRLPAHRPPGRSYHAMVYDAGRERIVVCAGLRVLPTGETWEWDGTDWALRLAGGPGGPGLGAAYDSARQRIISFGGIGPYDATYMYAAVNPAQYVLLGSACPGTPGLPALSADSLPWLGGQITVRISSAAPQAPAVLLHGFSNRDWGGIPLPLALGPIGAPLCTLYNSGDYVPAVMTNGQGAAVVSVPVPNSSFLLGLRFYDQFAVYDPGANALGFAFTRGGAGIVGAR